MRLNRYLSENLGLTRSQSRDLLARGRVEVNGTVCKKADTKVAEADTVVVEGKPLQKAEAFVYIMLNKPQGVVSAR